MADKRAVIANLRIEISRIAPVKYDAAYEYESDGVFYYTGFTYRGAETHRYKVRLWTDSDGDLRATCSCRPSLSVCAHMKRAYRLHIGH